MSDATSEKEDGAEKNGFSLRGLYTSIRRWFQPYYRETSPAPSKKSRKSKPKKRKASAKPQQATFVPVKIVDYPNPLTNVMQFKKKPSRNRIWCYHDKNVHQIVAHFTPGSGLIFKTRDNAARRELKPLIFPTNKGAFDRTHLIPIGYHGSENDPRLLVGWDSDANRKQFNDFEQVQKRRKNPVYWLTFITRKPWGARWHYMVYDVKTEQLLDELVHDYKAELVWK